MKIFAIFPDDAYMKSMSIHTMERPSRELQKHGVLCCTQGEFFESHYGSVSPDDVVIVWVGTRNEQWLDMLSDLKCRKFLRNIDSCKSDRVLFKREQEIFQRVGFEAMLVTYCTDYNKVFLAERNIRCIDYPHLIDFSTVYRVPIESKQFDVLLSGQMSETSYPVRTKIRDVLSNNMSRYKIAHVPHPGHSKQRASHQYHGDKYVDLAASCRLGVTCTGDDDSLVLKYLEFARAGTLPIGDYPTNMPDEAKASMVCVTKETSEVEILDKLDASLSDTEKLSQRIEQYRRAMSQFDIRKTSSILNKVLSASYDN